LWVIRQGTQGRGQRQPMAWLHQEGVIESGCLGEIQGCGSTIGLRASGVLETKVQPGQAREILPWYKGGMLL